VFSEGLSLGILLIREQNQLALESTGAVVGGPFVISD